MLSLSKAAPSKPATPELVQGADSSPSAFGRSAIFSRLFDVAGASAGLLLLSPLFCAIAVAIKFDDRGPVFFIQDRVGKGFRRFRIYKFRSMIIGAQESGLLTASRDPRLTRIGRVLRRYKLDELPQLLNVLRGDMQLVGARPEVERYVEMFRRQYIEILEDRPGITDPASLAYRREDEILSATQTEQHYVAEILPQKLKLSLEYQKRRTFRSDIAILLHTLRGLISQSRFEFLAPPLQMKIIKLAQTLLRKNSWFVGAFQAVLIFVSLVLSWFLIFDFTLPNRGMLFQAACLLILVRITMIAAFGLLHGWWRYTGLSDTLDVAKCVFSGSATFIVVTQYAVRIAGFPRSIYVLEPLLTAGILIGVRVFSRVLAESVRQDLAAATKVLLIGAGTGAQTVVREIGRPGSEYAPIGYVDDDRSKLGLKIEGIPVLGVIEQLTELVAAYPVDEVLIAVPSATSKEMQRYVEICERAAVKFRTVPALRDVIAQRVSISDFRDVNVDDLLGRDPIEIDLQSLQSAIHGRSIMVTGAAGSIGSELCRQLLEHEPAVLVCVDQSETGMFYLERELAPRRGQTELRCQVADAGNRKRMDIILRETCPEAIFHAAAYKHVPLMEENVSAAVQNNVFGLMNLLEVAAENHCRRFVLISSDKAVNPSSVMGATKRIGELLIAHQPSNGMRCLSVRFGNVLGSNGSVIPTLQQQLRKNEPLTVTHPEVKRFFMTIREAVSLVLQASVIGQKGDTLVLDMGEPLTILDLVRTLIKLSGRSEKQVAIQFTGLRPGEKLLEELFYENEEVDETSFPKIKKARGPLRDWEALLETLEELETLLFAAEPDTIRAKIKEILPEYSCAPDHEFPPVAEEPWPASASRSVA